MAIYDNNMESLKEHHGDIYEGIRSRELCSDDVVIGDAYDDEKFLALIRGQKIVALTSMYSPEHAAERYVEQYMSLPESTTVLLFGFGDGQVVRRLLAKECPVQTCIVYEPDIDVFMCAIQYYDLQDVLQASGLRLIIGDLNVSRAGVILNESVNYINYTTFVMAALPVYSIEYTNEYQQCDTWYQNQLLLCRGSRATAIDFAKSILRNEIMAQQWMIDSYAVDELAEHIPDDIPCIIVAAGPSLENNIQYLSAAKGKACIMAVDSAMKYLLDHNIVPDFTCTIDAEKSSSCFDDSRMKGIPVFLGTVSNGAILEKLEDFKPLYMTNSVEYYNILFNKTGHDFLHFGLGGSVATVLFGLALELKFQTIIIIGQDLAYTNMLSHAGTGEVTEDELTRYSMYEVEGYYGDTIITPGDFKIYLDWYQRVIAVESETHKIINATEGGARISGAIQMPLKEAIDRYCVKEINCKEVIDHLPKLWPTMQEKRGYYQHIYDGFLSLKRLKRLTEDGITYAEYLLKLLERGHYSEKEFLSVERKMNHTLDELQSSSLYGMVNERATASNIAMAEGLNITNEDYNDERGHLYRITYNYLIEMRNAVREAIPQWESSLKRLNDQYHFDR